MSRFVHAHSRDAYLLARALCRLALADRAHVAPTDLHFTRLAGGKPVVAAPATATPWHFNLSHTRGLVACLVATEVEVGVDVEHLRLRGVDALASETLTPAEYAAWSAAGRDERLAHFYRQWTRKEAYLKARGDGLAVAPRTVAIRSDRVEPPDGRVWGFADFPVPPGHHVALAWHGVKALDQRVCVHYALPAFQ